MFGEESDRSESGLQKPDTTSARLRSSALTGPETDVQPSVAIPRKAGLPNHRMAPGVPQNDSAQNHRPSEGTERKRRVKDAPPQPIV